MVVLWKKHYFTSKLSSPGCSHILAGSLANLKCKILLVSSIWFKAFFDILYSAFDNSQTSVALERFIILVRRNPWHSAQSASWFLMLTMYSMHVLCNRYVCVTMTLHFSRQMRLWTSSVLSTATTASSIFTSTSLCKTEVSKWVLLTCLLLWLSLLWWWWWLICFLFLFFVDDWLIWHVGGLGGWLLRRLLICCCLWTLFEACEDALFQYFVKRMNEFHIYMLTVLVFVVVFRAWSQGQKSNPCKWFYFMYMIMHVSMCVCLSVSVSVLPPSK